jgi:hypothetical protein
MHGVWPEVCCWGLGTIANFVASCVPMIGPATSFAMGEGNTMISALWGVFVWKEWRNAPSAGPARPDVSVLSAWPHLNRSSSDREVTRFNTGLSYE